MKNIALFIVLLIFSFKLFSQDSKISFELNYPIPLGDNFIGESYVGIIDIGADYRFVNLNPIAIGASLNGGILINNKLDNFKTTAYTIQPRVFGELNLKSIEKIHPSVGIGYTIMVLDASVKSNNVGNLDVSKTLSGFNLNFGIAYDITKKFFAQIQYDFIKLSKDDEVPDIPFNRNVNVLKIGLGYRL